MGDQPSAHEWIPSFAERLLGDRDALPTAEEQRLILELSRIAAHASERIAAPIVSYMVGLALAGSAPASREERIARLVADLGGPRPSD
jgi:hypothetical protein